MLEQWYKLPKHPYYKCEEWKKAIDCKDGRIREFFISKNADKYSLICNRFIFEDVDLSIIKQYIESL